MNESPVAREWRAEARSEGHRAGKIEGKAELLLRVLVRRGVELPDELLVRIRASADSEELDRWADAAAMATSLEDFRRETGL